MIEGHVQLVSFCLVYRLYSTVVTQARFPSIEITMNFASIHFRATSELHIIPYLIDPWHVYHRNDSRIDNRWGLSTTSVSKSEPHT